MIFGQIGLIKTLVWPSCSEIAVIFIGHVLRNSATHISEILKRLNVADENYSNFTATNSNKAFYDLE